MFEIEQNGLLKEDLALYGCLERLEHGGVSKHCIRCWMHDFFKGGSCHD